MKVRTRHFGEIEVREQEVLFFPEGIVGFESDKRYMTLVQPQERPFQWLQSLETPDVAFVVVDPFLFLATYDFEIDDETITMLEIDDPQQLSLLVIVTLNSDITKMTANLLAPIVVNRKNNKARQMVLPSSGYSTAHAIFAAAPK